MDDAMSELQELIGRVEKATGPDREIDARVTVHFDTQTRLPNDGIVGPGWVIKADHGYIQSPHYTASLDAVVQLVERELPGWNWERRIDSGNMFMRLISPEYERFEFMGARNPHTGGWCHAAPPLALLLAFLKAKLG